MAATYNLISSQVLGSSTASVTFSSIPQTYTDLVLRMSSRDSSSTGTANSAVITFNSDALGATGYSSTDLTGSGTAGASTRGTNQGGSYWSRATVTGTYTANVFSNSEFYIPNYTATSQKQVMGTAASENNASGAFDAINAGLYTTTTAISALTIWSGSGNFVQYSSFYLYGIRNS